MQLNEEQKEQMQRIFPNGWADEDVPALWRKEDEERHQKGGEIEEVI